MKYSLDAFFISVPESPSMYDIIKDLVTPLPKAKKLQQDDSRRKRDSTPVTLLSGFLGSVSFDEELDIACFAEVFVPTLARN